MSLDWNFFFCNLLTVLKAVPVTLEITIASLMIAILPAFFIARFQIDGRKILSPLSKFFVSVVRGTPIVLQILFVYSLLPSLLNVLFKSSGISYDVFSLNPIIYAFIVFGINVTAPLSECFRSALISVPAEQRDAALSIGLTVLQTYRRVVIPQAIASALPNLCSLTVSLVKNSSLAFMMTVRDITAVAKIEASYGYNYIEAYLDVLVIYVLLCSLIQFLFRHFEKRMLRSKNMIRV